MRAGIDSADVVGEVLVADTGVVPAGEAHRSGQFAGLAAKIVDEEVGPGVRAGCPKQADQGGADERSAQGADVHRMYRVDARVFDGDQSAGGQSTGPGRQILGESGDLDRIHDSGDVHGQVETAP